MPGPLLTNGSFEGTLSPWSLTTYGGSQGMWLDGFPDFAHTGAAFVYLNGGTKRVLGVTTNYGTSVTHPGVSVSPGERVIASAFVMPASKLGSWSASLRFEVSHEGAPFQIVDSVPYDLLIPGVYQQVIHPEVVAEGTTLAFRWTAPDAAGVFTSDVVYYLDDCVAVGQEAPLVRSRWKAHDALMTILKGINGAPTYRTNLGSRVYSKLVYPDDSGAISLPYVCVPLGNDAPTIEDDNGTSFSMTWTVTIVGVVGDGDPKSLDSTAVRDAFYLDEDIRKAILTNQTLSGTVSSVELASGGGGLAGLDDSGFGVIEVPVRLKIHFGADVIGPDA